MLEWYDITSSHFGYVNTINQPWNVFEQIKCCNPLYLTLTNQWYLYVKISFWSLYSLLNVYEDLVAFVLTIKSLAGSVSVRSCENETLALV